MTEAELLTKATELRKSFYPAYEIHRKLVAIFYLPSAEEQQIIDRVVLQVTQVDFTGINTYEFE